MSSSVLAHLALNLGPQNSDEEKSGNSTVDDNGNTLEIYCTNESQGTNFKLGDSPELCRLIHATAKWRDLSTRDGLISIIVSLPSVFLKDKTAAKSSIIDVRNLRIEFKLPRVLLDSEQTSCEAFCRFYTI